MKIEELRIGNLVLHNGKEERVAEIGTKNMNEGCCGYVRFKDKNIGSWLTHKGDDLIKPIPLTEESIVKFGFEKGKGRDGLTEYSKSIRLVISNSKNIYYSQKNIVITHVHQLQNLYFALTGEELTIKKLK